MPLQAQQIVNLACQTAKCPAWTAQAGQKLNVILSELCQDWDLDVARGMIQFNFFSGLLPSPPANSGLSAGSGPYTLPADWLRAKRNDVWYTIQGVQYIMIGVELAEFDSLVQQAGLNAYPVNYTVDNSPISQGNPPVMYVWPPPSGNFPVSARYQRQMPDIATPETSAVVPWFNNQQYLDRRLTGELMTMTNDDRAERYLGGVSSDGFVGAAALLDKYLKQQESTDLVKTVTLDRRRFNSYNYNKLPNTKTIGW